MRQRVPGDEPLLSPQVLILDEPTTALDILTQRTIIDLLVRLKADLGFSMLFLHVPRHGCRTGGPRRDHVRWWHCGLGSVNDIFYRPYHPYTLGLIHAVPIVTGDFEELVSIPGAPPDLIDPPDGCKFHPRCPYATERCRAEEPQQSPSRVTGIW